MVKFTPHEHQWEYSDCKMGQMVYTCKVQGCPEVKFDNQDCTGG